MIIMHEAKVILCRDCDWYKWDGNTERGYCSNHGVSNFSPEEFCSRGHRDLIAGLVNDNEENE